MDCNRRSNRLRVVASFFLHYLFPGVFRRSRPLLLDAWNCIHASGLCPSRSPLGAWHAPKPPAFDVCRKINAPMHAFGMPKHSFTDAGYDLPIGMRAKLLASECIKSGFQ